MVEGGGETTSEAQEEVLQEEDEAEVLQMSVAEEITRSHDSQVAIGLINKKFNVIIARNLEILHINVGRSSMTKESKVRTNRAIPSL